MNAPKAQIYLGFNGQCEEAFNFYVERLGAIHGGMFRYAGSPMAAGLPEGWDAKIMHGSITLGGVTINGADTPEGGGYQQPQGFQIFLEVDDPAETERLFNALADGATITVPVGPQFWSVCFGVLTDRFGIPWSLSCSQMPEGFAPEPAKA